MDSRFLIWEVEHLKKRLLCTAIIVGGVSVVLTLLFAALVLRPVALQKEPMDFSQVADGEYLGFCQNKILFAAVRARVQAHRLTDVEVFWHKESYLSQAQEFADAMVEGQTLDVDAVSGATLTCDTVRKATEKALLQGMPQGDARGGLPQEESTL